MSTVADKLAKKSSHKTSAKQVRLRLVYVDFWSAVKLSFLAAIALAIVTVVASSWSTWSFRRPASSARSTSSSRASPTAASRSRRSSACRR